AFQRAREVVAAGEIGEVFAGDLVFHNAYGPDKPWFYDRRLSGGGCVVDLGIHLVDLALWMLSATGGKVVSSQLFASGSRLGREMPGVEDYAPATLALDDGTSIRLACSWKLPAGRDAVISASLFGTAGGVGVHNVAGSFYDFRAERYAGTSR